MPDAFDAAFESAWNQHFAGAVAVPGRAVAPAAADSVDPYDAAFRNAVMSVYGNAPAAQRPQQSAAQQIANDDITRAAKDLPGKGSDALGGVSQAVLNLIAGSVRGAGSIGSSIMRVLPNALGGDNAQENQARRDRVDENVRSMGAQTDSLAYQGGKIAAEIAGTAGAGSVIAAPLRAVSGLAARAGVGSIPALDTAATALASGGFQTGAKVGAVADLATRAAAGTVTGAAAAGMVEPNDVGTGAAVGAAVPSVIRGLGAAGHVAKKGMQEFFAAASPEVRDLAIRAKDLGIQIPADRLVDSPTLNAMAASLKYIPLSGRTATEDAMNAQMNRAVSRTFGEDNPNIVKALNNARLKLGSQFDGFLKNNSVKIDQQFVQDLATVATEASQALTDDAASVVTKTIDNIASKVQNGEIAGDAAYNIKRTLDKVGRQNTPQAAYALDLKRVLMDALDRSVGPQEAAKFGKLRQQYGNMLAVEKLGPANGVEGEISAAKLANARDINNKDLQEVADIAAQFLKPREGQHGAAQRVFGASGVVGATTTSGAAMAGPLGAVVAPAAVMAGGRAANAILNSEAARNTALRATAAAPALSAPSRAAALAPAAASAVPVGGAALAAPGAPDAGDGGGGDGIAGGEGAPPSPATSLETATPTIADIGNAKTADEAIAAAGAAAEVPTAAAPARSPVAATSTAAAPAETAAPPLFDQSSASGPSDAGEPVAVWFGRRGSGYTDAAAATGALEYRQRAQPDLEWRVEPMRNGSFRLAGYDRPDGADGVASAGGVQATPNDTGTVLLRGEPDAIAQYLQQRGITNFLRSREGVLVGRSQAQQALN